MHQSSHPREYYSAGPESVITDPARWGATIMGSRIATAETHKGDTHVETEISTAAKLLIGECGKDADIVAARRADALFRDGNATEGTRWLKIFRKLAMTRFSHPGLVG